jgi:hypothetical protein
VGTQPGFPPCHRGSHSDGYAFTLSYNNADIYARAHPDTYGHAASYTDAGTFADDHAYAYRYAD